MELLTQESMEKKLFEWVDAAQLPMCVYAEGLLALALLDDQVQACSSTKSPLYTHTPPQTPAP